MSEERNKSKGFFKRVFSRDKDAEKNLDSEPEHSQSQIGYEAESSVHTSEETQSEGSFTRLVRGLKKTRSGFVRGLDKAFLGKKEIDEGLNARLEEVLVRADIGVKTAYELLEGVTEKIKRKELNSAETVMEHLKATIQEILSKVEAPLDMQTSSEPFIVMVLGVNGSGKTTTIAKLAAYYKATGKNLLMVAGDTFRAAAVDQLEIWADRIGCTIVKGGEKADPSSVAYEAIDRAVAEGYDLVLVDTAGRLHTRVPLMEQLKKMHRTIGKRLPGAPHEILLVIDSSMGQNAILQARTFNEAIPVTGIALTKLDGTSKGGVLVGISNELKIPVRFIGIGEKMDDLREFKAEEFTEALFAELDESEEK
jgi:fused signal recognition particle receptor